MGDRRQIPVHSVGALRRTKMKTTKYMHVMKVAPPSPGALESTCLPPMWPGFKSWRGRYMWVKFVFCSLLCSETFFTRNSGFLLSLNTLPNITLPIHLYGEGLTFETPAFEPLNFIK